MARIAYYHRGMREFIRIEVDILRERHEVELVHCGSRWVPLFHTARRVTRSDLVMSWFASWHSFIPVVTSGFLGVPSIVTVGGYDTAALPEIGYGHQRGGVRRYVSRSTMRLATRLIAISEFGRSEVMGLGVPEQKVTLIYLGLDPGAYRSPGIPREDVALMVAGINQSNRTRKGVEPFVRAAALVPELRFVVVGPWEDDAVDLLKSIATPNVCFTGRVESADLLSWFWRAKVIVQPSAHEAFGLSVAEGMLCGCVPVVTAAGALPEVVGRTGVIISSQRPEAVAEGVQRAMKLGPSAGELASAHVRGRFSIEAHRRALHRTVDEVLEESSRCRPVPSEFL